MAAPTMTFRTFLILTALTALAVVVCIRWIDYPLATFLSNHFAAVFPRGT